MQAALLGGVFIGVLSALPVVNFANCCCIWIIGGGILAAYLDQQNDPRPTTIGRGALAGLFAGLTGAVVWLVAALALSALFSPLQERLAGEFIRNARDLPPEARAMLENFGSRSAFRYVFGFILFVFVGGIFSTIGGILGAMFFRNDVPPAIGGPPPPLPPQYPTNT